MNDAVTYTSLNELHIWQSMPFITLEEMKAEENKSAENISSLSDFRSKLKAK